VLEDWNTLDDKFSYRAKEISAVEKLNNQKSLKSNIDPLNYAGPG
jgi:hypothetical protein